MRKYFTPSGRLTRLEFWLSSLVATVAFILAGAAVVAVTGDNNHPFTTD